jgi:WD40 repeat protein
MRKGHRLGVNRLLLARKDRILLSAGRDGVVRRWDLSASEEQHRLSSCTGIYRGHRGWVTGVCCMRDRLLLTSSHDCTLRLWDLDAEGGGGDGAKNCVDSCYIPPISIAEGHRDYVKALAVSSNAGLAISGGLDGKSFVWDVEQMAQPLLELPSSAEASEFSSRHFAGEYPEELQWELCSLTKGSIYAIDIDAVGAIAVTGSTDHFIRLFDVRAAAKICKLGGHSDMIKSVKLDPSSPRVISASSDGSLRLWDIRQQRCICTYRPGTKGGSRASAAIWDVKQSPTDGNVVYSGGRGRMVHRTDFMTGEECPIFATSEDILSIAVAKEASGKGDELWIASNSSSIMRGVCKLVDTPDTTVPPVAEVVLPGVPGIIKHTLLNNKRQLLTSDSASPPNIALWDLVDATCIEQYAPGTDYEAKAAELFARMKVRTWCSIDVSLGTPTVTLSETNVFDAEVPDLETRGDQSSADDQILLNLGANALQKLFGPQQRKKAASASSMHPSTALWISEEDATVPSRLRTILQLSVGEGFAELRNEYDTLLPEWISDCVLRSQWRTLKEPPKVQFVLVSEDQYHHINEQGGAVKRNQKLTAPESTTIRKVQNYVLSTKEMMDQLGEPDVSPTANEHPIEILCAGESLSPNLGLGAVMQYVWRGKSGTMVFTFRLRPP